MSELDNDIRLFIEGCIDAALTDPNIEDDIQKHLSNMGIESNLETMLSYMTGTILGSATRIWVNKRGKKESTEIFILRREVFLQEVNELLARRAMELRQHFVGSKYL